MFIKVTSTRRDGGIVTHILALADIAGIASSPKGPGAIITQQGNEYQIWTNETFAEVEQLVLEAGAAIAKKEESIL